MKYAIFAVLLIVLLAFVFGYAVPKWKAMHPSQPSAAEMQKMQQQLMGGMGQQGMPPQQQQEGN